MAQVAAAQQPKSPRARRGSAVAAARAEEPDPTHHGRMLQCKRCGRRYGTLEGLRLHMRNHHDVDKRWRCIVPGCTINAFARLTDLRLHLIRMHSPVRPFPCRVPTCPNQFAGHSELRRHIVKVHMDLVLELQLQQQRHMPG